MSRGQHKDHSHTEKRKAYNNRRKSPDYPKGGRNKVPNHPYKSV